MDINRTVPDLSTNLDSGPRSARPRQSLSEARDRSLAAVASDNRIGKLLLESGKIKTGDVERILQLKKTRNMRFGEAAVSLGLATSADIVQVLASQYDYPYLQKGEGNFNGELVSAYNPFSRQVEALRSLRSQLLLRWLDADHKALAIVSPQAGEGRSYLSANLAVVFSQLGERTLVLDANMRKPRQHAIFRVGNDSGLSTVLAGRGGIEAVRRIPFFISLSILPAGPTPPNPLELLSRGQFAELLDELGQRFDVILIDTPAGDSCSDALTIAARTGAALMVLRKNHTRMRNARQFAAQITNPSTTPIGAVINSF
jgi:receptor protein-tyrosine kinase